MEEMVAGRRVGNQEHPFVEEALKVLASVGHRITEPRKAVLRCLAEAHEPLTAPEVLQRLKASRKSPSVDKVSVYRVLEVLLEQRLVHQVAPTGGYMRCSHVHCSSAQHVILRCSRCAQANEHHIPDALTKAMFQHIKDHHDFEPTAHHFQVDGLCAECQKQR